MTDLLPTTDKDTPEKVVRVRLAMAHAFAQMLGKAFDALLYHGVNYRDLPEYKDTALLEQAERLPMSRGQGRYIEWMKRIESAITAAVKRKSFKKV